MARYGYISGRNEDQTLIQRDILDESGIEFDGGIVVGRPWGDLMAMLEPGDEVVVVARSRLGRTGDERQARGEMLELVGVRLRTLTREFEKGAF